MRRRAAQAAQAASAQAFSSHALRPLIFVLISLFLVLPMLIYNFATLDAAQFRGWTAEAHIRHMDDDSTALAKLPTRLRDCATVTRANISTSETIEVLREQCFTHDKVQAPSDMAHFIYLPVHLVPLLKGESAPPPEAFTMLQFAAVHSVRKHAQPSLTVLHYPATEPRGFWYTQCQRYLSLHRVLFPKLPTATVSSLNVYQRRDVMQLVLVLHALRVNGGIAFTDFNTLVLRPTRFLRQLPLVLSRSRASTFTIAPGMLIARAGNSHVAYLETTLRQMLEQDDPRLHNTPLDQLLGELVTESVQITAADAVPNVVLISPIVVEALDATETHELLSARPAEGKLHLRETVAIHVPTSQQTPHQQDAAITEWQLKLDEFETLAKEPSVLAAMMRFVISINTTNELGPLLQ